MNDEGQISSKKHTLRLWTYKEHKYYAYTKEFKECHKEHNGKISSMEYDVHNTKRAGLKPSMRKRLSFLGKHLDLFCCQWSQLFTGYFTTGTVA
jgi:hypothetical protein